MLKKVSAKISDTFQFPSYDKSLGRSSQSYDFLDKTEKVKHFRGKQLQQNEAFLKLGRIISK